MTPSGNGNTFGLPTIGTRFLHAGNRGSIRYTGPVDGTSGVWLGVEWDEPARGKHSGEKDNKQYFECLIPQSGSFIRPSPSIHYGRPFLSALRAKYVEDIRGLADNESVVLGSSRGAIQVEAVNMDKVRSKFSCLDKLREVSLDGDDVSECGAAGDEIRLTSPNIRGLDLSRTLLTSWSEVALICSQLPVLERLWLNQNRFCSFTLHQIENAFSSLVDLRINATFMTWSEMQRVLRWMPHLRTVETGHNRLSTLVRTEAVDFQPQLESINLDSNCLIHWSSTIGGIYQSYPLAHCVVLTRNSISTIDFPDTASSEFPIQSLKQLNISSNELTQWSNIDALDAWFPNLQTLTLAGNSIAREPYARQIIIAKLPSLLRLDSTDVSPRERVDSELLYLSKCTSGVATTAHAQLRLETLRLKHGMEGESPPGQPDAPEKLSSQLIRVNLREEDSSGLSGIGSVPRTLTLTVLPTMTLRMFKHKLKKTLRVPPKRGIQLWLQMSGDTLAELEGDGQDLDWWGIEAESSIVFAIETA